MYRIQIAVTTLIITVCLTSCSEKPTPEIKEEKKLPEASDVPQYDSLLAHRLGADEYGMKQYVLAYLKDGPNRTHSKEEAMEIQKAHMANITKMADEGRLAVAGPFMDDTGVRGIYIFNTSSLDSAAAWTNSDPAVMTGRLVMELHPWYCSAALVDVNNIHKKLEKTSIMK